MGSRLAAACCAALLAVCPAPTARAADFTIEDFHAGIVVEPGGALRVVERIEVTFHRPRHGIYRDLPVRYTDELGNAVTTPLDVVSVTDEAEVKRTWKRERAGNALRIRIGDAARFVEGRQVYQVAYRVEEALLFGQDRDELYWNVTGNDWTAEIRRASAIVLLPPGAVTPETQASCYTGPRGSTERSCSVEESSDGRFFAARRTFGPGEGLTVAVGWKKGVVTPPSAFRRILGRLFGSFGWLTLLFLSGLGFVLWLWRTRGRDPGAGDPIGVQYAPPKVEGRPLDAAELGGMVDERLDPRDITATVVQLAVKGYIGIEEQESQGIIFTEKDHYLKRRKPADAELSAFEQKVHRALFVGDLPGVMVSELKNRFYLHLPDLRETLFGSFVARGWFTASPEKTRKLYAAFGVAALIAGGLVGMQIAARSLFVNEAIGIAAGALPGGLLLLLARHMPAKTRAGARTRRDIIGFQEFLSRAEKDRLERMADKNLFEKYLPYAIALDVSERWAKAFEGILQEPPSWYTGSRIGAGFHPRAFERSLSGTLGQMSTSMYAAPRSSGGGSGGFSGGGGSSGGGFGGGGGGSW